MNPPPVDTAPPTTDPVRTEAGHFACVDPKPVLDFEGNPTNLLQCERGMLQRVERASCPSRIPEQHEAARDAGAARTDGGADTPSGYPAECEQDSDCRVRAYGYCSEDEYGYPACGYGCTVDEDCGEGGACLCEDPVGRCVSAACNTDADCTNDAKCTAIFDWDCSYNVVVRGFECQRAADACGGPGDCEGENAACLRAGDTDGAGRMCEVPNFDCGRPFVVAGAARTAPAQVGSWARKAIAPRLPEDASVRTRLAAHWTQVGLMEHASIAAFARFSLQLLSLGAGAELVEQSNRALGDELAHAEIAFALASAYSGVSVGPGCLSLANALEHESPESILELVVLEGCIGETVAALEAREAAVHCADPVVRAVLERIADDETRHAALAWRTLRWAIATDPSCLSSIEAAFETGLARLDSDPDTTEDLARHGVLSAMLRSELQARLREVLRAGVRALRTSSERRAA